MSSWRSDLVIPEMYKSSGVLAIVECGGHI